MQETELRDRMRKQEEERQRIVVQRSVNVNSQRTSSQNDMLPGNYEFISSRKTTFDTMSSTKMLSSNPSSIPQNPIVTDKYAERLQNYGITPGSVRARPAMHTPKLIPTTDNASECSKQNQKEKIRGSSFNWLYMIALVVVVSASCWMTLNIFVAQNPENPIA